MTGVLAPAPLPRLLHPTPVAGRDPRSALEQLRGAVAAAPDDCAGAVCDALPAALARDEDGDVALPVLRVL